MTVAGSVIETAKTFRPPADYDMNAPETARFVLQKSAVLEVGSDGADQTVDLSKVSGISSSSIRKIGSNKVTFVNKTSFAGALEVQSGTCVFDDTTLTSCVKRVSVASGATLHLATRARLETGSFVVGDVTAEANTLYTGGMFESLTGTGELFVAPARLEWTGARDDNPETSSNWANGADKYVLTSGLSLAYFGEHDTEGVWNVADGYAFGGFDFSEHVTMFTFDKTAPSGALALDSQGLVADEARAADSPAALTFNTPLSWTGARTPLDIAENVNVTFNGPWCGVASQDQTIVKYGAGNVYVRGEHATYTGSLIISNGTVYAYGEEPFGPQNESGTARIELNPTDTEAKKRLVLSGTTIGKDIILNTSSSYRRGLVCAAGTTNVITGYLDGSGVCAMVIDKNAKLVLKGGYGEADRATSFYANWGGSGTLAIENKPMYIGMLEGGLGNLHISVPGNKIEAMRAWHKTDNYYPHGVNLTVDCDWAFDLKNAIFCTKGTIDFRGTSQRLGAIYNEGTYISQTGPATLYLAATNSISASFNRLAAPPSPGDFAGQFSLVVEAARDFTFAITERAVSATGTVAVTSGTLAFVNGASWLNATNVTVSGSGRLEINQSETFGRKSNFDLSGGTLALADGVVQKAQFLYVDGVKMPLGVYGASDNAAIAQSFRTPYIAGSGVLEVMGDGVGTFILLK